MTNTTPRYPLEVIEMLKYLENERNRFIRDKCIPAALAIGAQIKMLQWSFNIQEEYGGDGKGK